MCAGSGTTGENVIIVLRVDDNRLMQEGLQNLLEAHNIEVTGVIVKVLDHR